MKSALYQRLGASVIFVLAMTVISVSPALAGMKHAKKFVGPERVTAVSGYAGSYKTLRPNTDFSAIVAINWWEETDDPRQVTIKAHHITSFDPKTGTAKLHTGARGNRKAVAFYAGALSVYKIQVCTTSKKKTKDNKLKGMRIWVRSLEDTKQVKLIDQSAPQAASHRSCKKWHPAVACGRGQLAVGIRLHYNDYYHFSGAALICRSVAPK